MLYLTGFVAEWRLARSQSIESCPQVKLREAEYIWETACYVIWPAAARRLLASLPVDGPVDKRTTSSRGTRWAATCAPLCRSRSSRGRTRRTRATSRTRAVPGLAASSSTFFVLLGEEAESFEVRGRLFVVANMLGVC